jgi:hypothetical protein
MSDLEETPQNPIVFDSKTDTKNFGSFHGAVIAKYNGDFPEIVFSDNIQFDESGFRIKGLHLGLRENKGYSIEQEDFVQDVGNRIDYCVVVPPSVVEEFDNARFNASFPNIVRFLHTACVYADNPNFPLNHLEFVQGEILNRPVAVNKNGSLIVADRLVVTEMGTPIFYDAIMIERFENGITNISYEPFANMEIDEIQYILLIGAENF